MHRFLPRSLALAAVAILAANSGVRAALTLTPTAVTQGFGLSTFATGFPSSSSVGPTGIVFLSSGAVMVSDYPGNVRVFASDVDGQTAASASFGQNYGLTNALGLATVGNSIYMTRQAVGDLVQLNANGTLNQVIVTGISGSTGVVTNPFTSHLFVGAAFSGQIYDVDPVAKTKSVFFTTGTSIDGLSLSSDGKTLYGAENGIGHLIGIDTTTKAVVLDIAIGGGIDGTAVGTGTLAGNIFVNLNNGTLLEINLTTQVQTLIATGGSRGDFVAVDPNGTLLVTQTDSIVRLTAPAGGGFAAPEPSSVAMLAIGCLGSWVVARRRRATA